MVCNISILDVNVGVVEERWRGILENLGVFYLSDILVVFGEKPVCDV